MEAVIELREIVENWSRLRNFAVIDGNWFVDRVGERNRREVIAAAVATERGFVIHRIAAQ